MPDKKRIKHYCYLKSHNSVLVIIKSAISLHVLIYKKLMRDNLSLRLDLAGLTRP